MPSDPLQQIREIALAIVPDPEWCNDPDNAALLDLVLELDITDASQIEDLLSPGEPWTASLASALASRTLPERVDAPPITRPPSTTSPNELVPTNREFEFEEWADAGFLSQETARLWATTRMGPADASAWYDLDLRGPEEAMRWAEAGFTPDSAREWVDLLDDPSVAANCLTAGLPPSEAAGLDRRDVAELTAAVIDHGATWSELRPYLARGVDRAMAFDWIQRRQVNPVREEWAYEWATLEFTLSDAVRWHASGFPQPEEAQGWRAKGFDAGDAAAWTATGVATPSEALELRSCLGSPDAFTAWSEMGISDPALISGLVAAGVGWSRTRGLLGRNLDGTHLRTIARNGPPTSGLEEFIGAGRSVEEFHRWRDSGFDVPSAVDWIAHGFESPEVARRWNLAGTDLSTARRWSDADFDPDAAIDWISFGFSPRQARAWVANGVEQAKSAQAWKNAGVSSPVVARAWQELGCDRPDQALSWIGIGFSLASATPWTEAGIDPDVANELASHRLSPTSATKFATETGRPAEELIEWLSHGIRFKEALEWHAAGITSPTVVRRRRIASQPATWRRLTELGLTGSEVMQIASSSVSEHDVAVLARRAGPAGIQQLRASRTPPRDWARWVRVCNSVGIACNWLDGHVDLDDLEATIERHGLDPRDLRMWASAGFEPKDVIGAYNAGFTRPNAWRKHLDPPKRSTPQPKAIAKPVVDPFDEWTRAGQAWLDAVGADVDRYDGFLRMIHEEGLEWADPDEDVLSVDASAEWLDEIHERLTFVSDALQKEPHWPKVFESQELTIVLDGTGEYPLAWIGDGESGGLVCFHHERYEIYTAATNASWRYMAGAAISWYIDCCIVLRVERRGTPFALSRRSNSKSGLDRAVARYAPRPTFVSQYETVRRGGGTSPRAHLVDGFVRTYRLGQQPTEEARNRAPARIRRRLQPNQTWVSPFIRGGQYAVELETYLSKYSALADAMAFADQDSNA